MSNSSGSASFQCPKCWTEITVRLDQAGSQIRCPSCQATLSVPENLGTGDLFDDLFDESPHAEENPNTISDESELDTGFLEEINVTSFDVDRAVTENSVELPADTAKPPAFKGEFENAGEDPFEYDEAGPLRIDGITDSPNLTDGFYFKCPVCDSELQATENQISQKIRCTDCHSEIRIAKPDLPKKPQDPWRQPASVKEEAQDEFSLEPPVERPKIDPSYGLENVTDDLLAPPPTPESTSLPPAKKPARSGNGPQTKKRPKQDLETLKQPAKMEPVATGANHHNPPESKRPQLKQVFELQIFQDLDLMIRSLVVTIFLGLGYSMFDYVWHTYYQADLNAGEKFVQCFPALLGSFVCCLVAAWFLAITFSVMMRSVANGDKKVQEWIGFSPSEWLGNFLVVLVSGWAASLPGVFFGFLAFKITGWFVWLPTFAAISTAGLLPLLLISSFYNESVYNIFSSDVLATLSSKTDVWTGTYKLLGIALLIFFVGLLVLFIPGIFFSMVGAAMHVVAVTLAAIFVGMLAHNIVGRLA